MSSVNDLLIHLLKSMSLDEIQNIIKQAKPNFLVFSPNEHAYGSAILSLLDANRSEALTTLGANLIDGRWKETCPDAHPFPAWLDEHFYTVYELLTFNTTEDRSDVADGLLDFLISNHQRNFVDKISSDLMEEAMDRDSCLLDATVDYIIDRDVVIEWIQNNV